MMEADAQGVSSGNDSGSGITEARWQLAAHPHQFAAEARNLMRKR